MFPDLNDTDGSVSCQIRPRDGPHTLAIIVILLSGLLSQTDAIQQRRTLGRHLSLLQFVLSNLGRVWAALSTNSFYMQVVSGFGVGTLVRCLRDLLRLCIGAATTSTNVSKASLLLYRIISVVLVRKPPEPTSLFDSEVCQALLDISLLAQQSTTILHSFKEVLLPKLFEVVNAQEHYVRLSDELRVGVCATVLAVSILKSVQHAVMSALRYGENCDPLLYSERLVVQSENLAATHSIEHLVDVPQHDIDIGADAGPRKRLRLEEGTSRPKGENIGLVLSRRISHVLGLPKTTAFAEVLPCIRYVRH